MRDALNPPPSFPGQPQLGAAWKEGRGRFLIDGFPRQMDQALKFDESVSGQLTRVPLRSPKPRMFCRAAPAKIIGTTNIPNARSVNLLSSSSSLPQKKSCSAVCSSEARPLEGPTTTKSPSSSVSVSEQLLLNVTAPNCPLPSSHGSTRNPCDHDSHGALFEECTLTRRHVCPDLHARC
jgi:hypothetical protein